MTAAEHAPGGGGTPAGESRHLFPLTAPQRGIWFAETLSPDYSVNIAQYFDIRHAPDSLDLDLLRQCNEDVGKLLEAPYIRFDDEGGLPVQYVDVDFPQEASIHDFRDHADPVGAALAWMESDYRRTVDLRTDQLVVAELLRVSDSRTFWYQRAHHIVCDGNAAISLARRILDRYNAIKRHETPDDSSAATLAEIVEYDQSYVDSSRRTKDREHWASRIAAMPEPVTLARANGAAPPTEAIVARRSISRSFQERLGTVSSEVNSSQAALLTAAFAAFMSRMCSTDDVVLSLPVTGRTTARIRRSAGMLSNILPIRLRDLDDCTVRDLAIRATVELTGALRHQRYRTEDIRREAGLDVRKLHFGPAINMMFFDEVVIDDADDIDYHVLSTGIIEDLAVNLYQPVPGASLAVDLQANPNLYRQDEIEEHLDRFLVFAERLYADLDQNILAVDLMLPGESEKLSSMEQGDELDGAAASQVLERFTQIAGESPESVAIEDDDRSWTYAQVDRLRRELAYRLIASGVRPGDRVAIALPRSIEQVLAIYAVWTASASYVPIDVELPATRQSFIMETAMPRLVLDADYLRDSGFSAVSVPSGPMPDLPAPPEAAMSAYVLFTSGSTGTPKGVEVSHRAISARMAWGQQDLPLTPDDVVIYKTPFTFDVSLPELVAPLQVGARMFVARADGHREPDYLRRVIAAHGVTSVHFVPSMLEVFIQSGVINREPVLAPTVRRVIASGEALPASTADRAAKHTDAVIVNLYGPTEAAVEVTEYVVKQGDRTIPIGHPVPGMSVRVLDANLRRVPAGVAGELYLAGDQLAYGYIGATERTSHRFVADPFSAGARMYRTGDLVRWNPVGELEYLGRTDHQVKVRGQRVELGEIEAVLTAHPGVESAVVVVNSATAAPILVAYVKPAGGGVADLPGELTTECRRTLPGHMVPVAVIVVDRFPTNAAGKLDRAALPEPDLETLAVDYVAPETAEESAVADVFAEVLGMDHIGVTESFFHSGGDSLLAMRAVAKLGEVLGVNLTVRDLFSSPTVRDLVHTTKNMSTVTLQLARNALRPPRIPIAEAQRGMWLINRADPVSPVYNMPFAFRVIGALDIDGLRAAIVDLLDRQEALRTRYPMVDGEPVQVIDPVDDVLANLDLTPRSAEGTPAEIVADVAAEGFDVAERAPIRSAVYQRESDEYVIVIVVHHINADGVSLWPLAADFMAAYRARVQGEQPDWSPLGPGYADYALWHQARLDQEVPTGGSERERQLAYWRERLAGAPPILGLPTDRPRPMNQSFEGGTVDFVIPEEVIAGLESIARDQQATLFMAVHAAYALLLARLSGQRDIVVGIPYAGRSAGDLDGLVGMFMNSLALRTDVDSGERFTDLLDRVRVDDLQDMAHADVAFEAVVDAVGARRRGSANPIFQTVLSFQNMDFPEVNLHGLTVEPVDLDLTVAKVDLQLTLYPGSRTDAATGDGVRAEVAYATALFDRGTIDTLVERFQQLLRSIVANPVSVVGDLSIAVESDSASTVESDAVHLSLPQVVETAGRENPAVLAVDGYGSSVSFGELAGMATAMATTFPDPDSALVTALFTLIPELPDAGPDALGDVLADLRVRACAGLQTTEGS